MSNEENAWLPSILIARDQQLLRAVDLTTSDVLAACGARRVSLRFRTHLLSSHSAHAIDGDEYFPPTEIGNTHDDFIKAAWTVVPQFFNNRLS